MTLLAFASASCSSNDTIVSPATDLGVYGVVETENHVPAVGALILLESHVDPIAPVTQHDFFASVRSVPGGGFGFGPVPAGQYTLLAGYSKATPAAGATFDSLVSYSSVAVTDPTSYRIPERLTVRRPATIVGRVITSTSGLMYLYAVGSSGQVTGASPDANGVFTLEGVPQGTWRVMGYDLAGGSPLLAVTVGGVVTRFGETTRMQDVQVPSP
jgi:hypothetical protein